jgi:hypothetical protein
VPKNCLYDDFAAWCQQRKKHNPGNSFFWKRMRELTDSPLKEIRKRNDSDRRRRVEMPSLAHCQQALATAMCCDWSELDAEA